MSAVMKHDARHSYSANNVDPTVNDIATSLKSFNFNGDDDGDENMTQTQTGTYRTFASNYSSCTNMSFSKLLNGFRSDSPLHKEMLAILAALTDVIKERGGTQTSTEYFLALMETIEAANEDNEIIASISLLNMGIRTVSEAVLRMKFSETASLLLMHMQRFLDTDNQNILKNVTQNRRKWSKTTIITIFSFVDYWCNVGIVTCTRTFRLESIINQFIV